MNLIDLIQKHLTPDLLKPSFRGGWHAYSGHCYVASEAAWHLFAKDQGYYPCFIRHEDAPHWFLSNGAFVMDLTAAQFNTSPDYSKARRNGFLTKQPSKRAQILMNRVLTDKTDELAWTVPVWP